jgi:PPK2 family polyphosphate:nucleotide phosphotransferase
VSAHPHRLSAGPVDLAAIPTDATPGFAHRKSQGKAALSALGDELSDLQERLWAERTTGSRRRVLLVLQGMDTSGKGGVLRHTVGLVDPQGVEITSFKAPTEEERRHDFLWRIRNALPKPGMIGVFDRSHYEDVLVVRVRNLVPRAVWQRRYAAINRFERGVVAQGCVLVKVMLHISREEQRKRMMARLDRPDKHWKYNPGDIDERRLWPDYMDAYQVAFDRTSTGDAPWYVVPANRKWYARLAVQHLLIRALKDIDPRWPVATFDVDAERKRLLSS